MSWNAAWNFPQFCGGLHPIFTGAGMRFGSYTRKAVTMPLPAYFLRSSKEMPVRFLVYWLPFIVFQTTEGTLLTASQKKTVPVIAETGADS